MKLIIYFVLWNIFFLAVEKSRRCGVCRLCEYTGSNLVGGRSEDLVFDGRGHLLDDVAEPFLLQHAEGLRLGRVV